ncbi:MAG: malonyl-ACP O-methyltransferase BioC [Pseudomonadota bacterium]
MRPETAGGAAVAKGEVARDFGAASTTYETASRLQRLMGTAMLERLPVHRPGAKPLRILDLGCGTGYFTRQLAQRYPDARITAADLSPGMIEHARKTGGEGISWVLADAERLPFADGAYDVVFSNLMVQWSDCPGRVFDQCRRVLAPGGVLHCSTLLDGSLCELEQAWALADPGHRHVNRFETMVATMRCVEDRLPGASVEAETVVLDYDSPQALIRELKCLGAVYKGADRRRTLTAPGRVRAMFDHYPRTPSGHVMASYEACWISYGN